MNDICTLTIHRFGENATHSLARLERRLTVSLLLRSLSDFGNPRRLNWLLGTEFAIFLTNKNHYWPAKTSNSGLSHPVITERIKRFARRRYRGPKSDRLPGNGPASSAFRVSHRSKRTIERVQLRSLG